MERAIKFLNLLKKGKTYREIGELFKVSKTLVYLELRKYFKEQTKDILSKRSYFVGKRHKAKEPEEFTCLNCGKTKMSKYRYHKLYFCDHKCRGEFMRNKYAVVKKTTKTHKNLETS